MEAICRFFPRRDSCSQSADARAWACYDHSLHTDFCPSPNCPRRCSEREAAGYIGDQWTVISGWLPSLTFTLAHSAMRIVLMTAAAIALVLFSLCEVGMAYPVAWWLYLSVAVAFAAGLIRPAPVRSQFPRVGVLVVLITVIAVLYFVEWTTRKPFLRDLARVRVGMTETEVRRIMGRYMEGTGWPANPFDTSTNATSTLTDVGSGSQYSTTTSPSGEMVIRDSLVFRHSTDGAFNSDWGIISLSSGRVVSVEFSPD